MSFLLRLLPLGFGLALAAAETEPPVAARGPAAPGTLAPGSASPASIPPADGGASFRFDRLVARTSPAPARWSAAAAIGLGYDSNILRENQDRPVATDARGLAASVEGQAQVRLVQAAQGRLTLGGTAAMDDYPGEHAADLVRYGGFLAGSWSPAGLGIEPGVVASRHQFRLDDAVAADATTLNLFATRVRDDHVDIAGGSAQRLVYRQDAEADGRFYDLSYRHWFLLEPANVSRRIEAGLRLGTNRADGDADRYRVLTPSAAGSYRFAGGSRADLGTIDLALRASLDLRAYDEPVAGDDHRVTLLQAWAQADYWWNRHLATGAYGGFSRRASTDDSEDFQRTQAGLRLAASW